MADYTEVASTIAGIIAAAVYPDGTDEPSAIGAPVKIYPGWPSPTCLDTDLKAGTVNISVFPMASEQNVTRHLQEYQEISRGEKTLGFEILSATTFEITGAVTLPMHIAVRVNGRSVAYACQAGDTPTTIAAALATLIAADITPASSSGAIVSIPSGTGIAVGIGVGGALWRELKRQSKWFMVTVWAPSPGLRAAAGIIADRTLAAATWLALPDYTGGRNIYVKGFDQDDAQEALLYRRDLIYDVEYMTIETVDATEVTFIELGIDGSQLPLDEPDAGDPSDDTGVFVVPPGPGSGWVTEEW